MNKTRQTVATAAVVSFAVIVLANLNDKPNREGGLPQVNQVIAYAVVFLFLSILADFGLEFAGGLSLIAMFGILFGPQPFSDSQLSPIEDALQFLGARGGF